MKISKTFKKSMALFTCAVFVLCMFAMSASAAITVGTTTYTAYNISGDVAATGDTVSVKTQVTGATVDSQVTFLAYLSDAAGTPGVLDDADINIDNVAYIDQVTAAADTVNFEYTTAYNKIAGTAIAGTDANGGETNSAAYLGSSLTVSVTGGTVANTYSVASQAGPRKQLSAGKFIVLGTDTTMSVEVAMDGKVFDSVLLNGTTDVKPATGNVITFAPTAGAATLAIALKNDGPATPKITETQAPTEGTVTTGLSGDGTGTYDDEGTAGYSDFVANVAAGAKFVSSISKASDFKTVTERGVLFAKVGDIANADALVYPAAGIQPVKIYKALDVSKMAADAFFGVILYDDGLGAITLGGYYIRTFVKGTDSNDNIVVKYGSVETF